MNQRPHRHRVQRVTDDLATAVSSPLHSRRGSGYQFELKKHQTHERRIVSTPAPNTPPPGEVTLSITWTMTWAITQTGNRQDQSRGLIPTQRPPIAQRSSSRPTAVWPPPPHSQQALHLSPRDRA